MKIEKIFLYIGILLALAAAVWFYYKWSPESLLRKKETPIVMTNISQDGADSFTGLPAGEDIPRLSGKVDFENMDSTSYVTAEPVGILPTGVYSLKTWVSPYISRTVNGRTTKTGKRKAEVIRSKLDIQEDYNQYYLLALPDHSYILAQISKSEAAAIRRGKHVTLPIGKKKALSSTARNYLMNICTEYDVSMDGVLYTFDDAWYEEHKYQLFFIRFGVSIVIFLVLAAGFGWAENKISKVKMQ